MNSNPKEPTESGIPGFSQEYHSSTDFEYGKLIFAKCISGLDLYGTLMQQALGSDASRSILKRVGGYLQSKSSMRFHSKRHIPSINKS